MISSDVRIVVDIDSGNTVWTDCGWQIGEGEVTDLNVAVITDVGLNPRTGLANKRPCNIADGQQGVSAVAKQRGLSGTANLSASDDVERDSIRGDS